MNAGVFRFTWVSLVFVALGSALATGCGGADERNEDKTEGKGGGGGSGGMGGGGASGGGSGGTVPRECTTDRGEYEGDVDFTGGDVGTESWYGYSAISGDLRVDYVNADQLMALSCLVSVGGEVSFDTDYLTDLEGLSSLQSAGSLDLSGVYPSLRNLSALRSLTTVRDTLRVTQQSELPDCEVCKLLVSLDDMPTTVDVHDNLDDECTPVPSNCP